MVWAIAVNGIMGVIMVITLCFCIGDIEDAVNSITRQPWIQIFYGATGSHAGATVMTLIISLLCLFNVINNVLSASRQMFAFARDRGLPFSSFLGYVSHCLVLSFGYLCITKRVREGQTWLGHSLERNLHLLLHILSPRPDQYRQYCRIQCRRLPWHRGLAFIVYHLHLLRAPKTLARRTTLTPTLELGTVGNVDQRDSADVPLLGVFLQLLATVHAGQC